MVVYVRHDLWLAADILLAVAEAMSLCKIVFPIQSYKDGKEGEAG